MLTIGDPFPHFYLRAVVSCEPGKESATISNETYRGKWQVVFFYPKDATSICASEVIAFGQAGKDFESRGAQLLSVSLDSVDVHLAWRKQPELANLSFPMISDNRHELSDALGILAKDQRVALRATFIVDPRGIIRHVSVNEVMIGRNTDEVLRILDALQTGGPTLCNWHRGTPTP